MDFGEDEFHGHVVALLRRFLARNGRPAPSARELHGLAGRLAGLIRERGLPRPLAAGECGTPGGLPEAEVAEMAARVGAGSSDLLLADAVKQLVKACFYPEFTVCRDSYREVGRDGICRRQQVERAQGRISGVHCVDCPHWVAIDPALHPDFVQREWRGDPGVFLAHRDLFLPLEFGALRRWLHAAARQGGGAESRKSVEDRPGEAAGGGPRTSS